MENFWGDFYSQAVQGLGVDTGANAAKTTAKVLKNLTTDTSAPAVASNLPDPSPGAPAAPTQSNVMKYGAIALAGVALLYFVLGD